MLCQLSHNQCPSLGKCMNSSLCNDIVECDVRFMQKLSKILVIERQKLTHVWLDHVWNASRVTLFSQVKVSIEKQKIEIAWGVARIGILRQKISDVISLKGFKIKRSLNSTCVWVTSSVTRWLDQYSICGHLPAEMRICPIAKIGWKYQKNLKICKII